MNILVIGQGTLHWGRLEFGNIGNYYIPIYYLIDNICKCQIIVPPPITKKTIELGSKYSPTSRRRL